MTKQYIKQRIDFLESTEFFPYQTKANGEYADFDFDDVIKTVQDLKRTILQRHDLHDYQVFLRHQFYSDGSGDFEVIYKRLETDEEYEERMKKEQKERDKKEKAKQKKIDNLLKSMSKEEIIERLGGEHVR